MALLILRREAVGGSARDDDVVALPVRKVAEDRLQRAAALVHEDDLVALAVSVEEIHRLGRPAERDLDVVVPHEQTTPADRIAFRIDLVSAQVTVSVAVRHPPLARDRLAGRDRLNTAGGMQVVQDRLVPGEALEPHDLLGQKRPVLSELDVALAREAAEVEVGRHGSTGCRATLALARAPRRAP